MQLDDDDILMDIENKKCASNTSNKYAFRNSFSNLQAILKTLNITVLMNILDK